MGKAGDATSPSSFESRLVFGRDCIRLYRIFLANMTEPGRPIDHPEQERLLGVCILGTYQIRTLAGIAEAAYYHARRTSLGRMGFVHTQYGDVGWDGEYYETAKDVGEGVYILRPTPWGLDRLRKFYHVPDDEVVAVSDEAQGHPIVIPTTLRPSSPSLRIWEP